MQVAICLTVVYGGCSIVLAREGQRKHDQQLLDLVYSTDLSALYLQINLDSFGGQLPADLPVSWGQLGGNDSGGIYLGEPGFDPGKPTIRISIR